MTMNQNELKQSKKVEAIKAAIERIAETGAKNFSKKLIAETTEKLFGSIGDPDYIVSQPLLSKPFYKENIQTWIEEIVGKPEPDFKKNREKAVQAAVKAKQKNVKKKYKQLEKDAFKVVDMILSGKITVEKFTKKFLLAEINKLERVSEYGEAKIKYGDTIFTDEKYEQIFYDAHARLVGSVTTKDSNESQKVITALEYSRLQEELKECKRQNKSLLKRMFVVAEGDEELLGESDALYSKLVNIQLNGKILAGYLQYLSAVAADQKEMNAYDLIKIIVEKCQTSKK